MIRVTRPATSPNIANYVQGVFILEQQENTFFRLPLFANGTPTLVFHNAKESHTNSHLTLFGQTISPGELLLEGKFTLIAYFLRPWCLPSLFRLAGVELTDNPVDFSVISKDRNLGEKLLNAGTTKQMLSLLDDHIARLAAGSSPEDPRAKYAAARIISTPQIDVLTSLRQDLYITERSFQRVFQKNIGVSPNQFRRIIQFNNAFRQLNERKFSKLSDIAFDNGYADQSHFNRTFREFTDQTAMQYLDSCPLI